MRRLAIVVALIVFSSSSWGASRPNMRHGDLSFSMTLGYQPNSFNLSGTSEDLGGQNARIQNRIQEINKLYSNASGDPVVGDYRHRGSSINSVPVEASLRYSFYGLMVRVGFVYHNIATDIKDYTSTVGPGTVRLFPSDQANLTLYEDITDLYDNDPSNDEVQAFGLRPTYSQKVRYTQYFTGKQIEVPVTFAISMLNLGPASFYFGGGFTYFHATKTRIISAEILDDDKSNADFFVDDTDKFTGSTVGFHIMTGAEYRFTKTVGLVMDLTFNFATTSPIQDSVRTGAFTNNTLFHSNDNLDKGGNENSSEKDKELAGSSVPFGDGVERTSALDFTGFRIMIGLSYHILSDPPKEKPTVIRRDDIFTPDNPDGETTP